MRIVVSNNTLSLQGGSESYAYCVIAALKKRGHYVDAFTTGPTIGTGDKIKELGVKVLTDRLYEYDVAFSSHLSTTKWTHQVAPISIQTCHGIYPDLEQPDPRVTKLVSISKEVQNHISNKGMESTMIHNGIDCERFQPIKPINSKLKKVFSLAHDQGVNKLIATACHRAGIEFSWHNKFINPIFDIETKILEADLVVTLGRGAYESMACGRAVIILDKRDYSKQGMIGDGILTPDIINKSLENNCSGRALKRIFNEEILLDEFKKYDSSLGDFGREYALEHLNIDIQIEKYLSLVS